MRLSRWRPRNDFNELRTFIGRPLRLRGRHGHGDFGAEHRGVTGRRQWRGREARRVDAAGNPKIFLRRCGDAATVRRASWIFQDAVSCPTAVAVRLDRAVTEGTA